MLDLELFRQLLAIDSTSGNEAEMMDFLRNKLDFSTPLRSGRNDSDYLLLSWGTPQVVFCTHVDTVPPYIAPTFHRADGSPCPPQEAAVVRGRGACDAKGQLLAMLTACRELAAEGSTGFGLLLVTGEETGSWGAKAFAKTDFRAPYLIVGEPTENKMVSAAKGTKAYELTFRGEAFHSGYPEYGRSAVDAFLDFCNALKAQNFGIDPELGETTWNIGRLVSDNPQNILSPELTCRLYFRTTFVSDQAVQDWMRGDSLGPLGLGMTKEVAGIPNTAADSIPNTGCSVIPSPESSVIPSPERASVSPVVEAIGGDTPARYMTLPGFETGPVAFGSDAPHLTNFTHKIICGPGSIRFAHRDDEHILVRDLEKAVEQYKTMFRLIYKLL